MKRAAHICELLSPIDPNQAQDLLKDPRYCMQLKEDGERLLVDTSFGGRFGFDRKGQITALSADVLSQLADVPADCLIDGELVNGKYIAFDVLEFDSVDIRGLTYEMRMEFLTALHEDAELTIVPTWYGTEIKTAACVRTYEAGAEGVVFKDLRAPWAPGRAGQHFKLKFWESCSVRVGDKSQRADAREDKHSVAVELVDGDGSWRPMGFVTIPNSLALPAQGTILEVRYLYAQADGLYQGVFLGVRRDLDSEDCSIDQLKWKTEREAYV